MRSCQSQKRITAFFISLLFHALFFVPALQIPFKNIFQTKNIPVQAAIQFQFYAPVPQKQIIPQKEQILQPEKSDPVSGHEKKTPEEDKLRELIRSVESKRKSQDLKTIVPQEELDEEKLKWDYARFLRKSIKGHLVYPREEHSHNIEDSVRIVFCIDKDGRLIGQPEIPDIYRSRYDNFNTAAMQAVVNASKTFPPLPKGLKKHIQYFDMVIEFSK